MRIAHTGCAFVLVLMATPAFANCPESWSWVSGGLRRRRACFTRSPTMFIELTSGISRLKTTRQNTQGCSRREHAVLNWNAGFSPSP